MGIAYNQETGAPEQVDLRRIYAPVVLLEILALPLLADRLRAMVVLLDSWSSQYPSVFATLARHAGLAWPVTALLLACWAVLLVKGRLWSWIGFQTALALAAGLLLLLVVAPTILMGNLS